MQDKTDIKFANLFASPLAARVLPDTEQLNQKLVSRIQAHEQDSPGESKTNVGGWHSETGQLEFCGDAGMELIRHIYAMTDEVTQRVLAENNQPWRPMRWTLHAWANVNRPGDFNRVHTHAGSTWSGTYYVDAGDPDSDEGTPIHLLDPCQGRANTFLSGLVATTFLQRPQAGMLILFPSYVPHMVYAHRGGRPRISIAFNMRKEPYP
ncbi:MAG TPA: putative 2OG-Fe(II) oxygenase [Rhizomicrobium sp.]|nr:putative 2OG-Fe(II) oxygenase [Rhizomicrobium sp.]